MLLTTPRCGYRRDIDLPELWLVVETIAEVDATVSWHLANSGIAGLAFVAS